MPCVVGEIGTYDVGRGNAAGGRRSSCTCDVMVEVSTCVLGGGVFGPGSTFREVCPTTMCPAVEVKIGTRLISVCGPPTSSQSIHTLYDAPNSVGL